MFDDLDKVVPKLDEDDKNKMYNNINRKTNVKREKRINGMFVLALASLALVLAVFIPVGILISNQNKANKKPNVDIITTDIENITTTPIDDTTTKPNENNNGNIVIGNSTLDENNFLGYVAHSAFNKKEVTAINNQVFNLKSFNKGLYFNDTENVEDKSKYNISYPYDYIKIENAFKFTLEINDISDSFAKETIENNCGLGKLDIVVADFKTYIDEGYNIKEYIADTLISFKGYNGFYTILENGASYYSDGTSIQRFSSHKKLTSTDIVKDFTGTILTISVKNDIGKKYVYFKSRGEKLDESNYDQSESFMYEGTVEEISSSELYSVLELNELQKITIKAKVLEVNLDDKYIKLENEINNLRYIVLTDKNFDYDINSLKAGDVLIITYSKLFDDYDPVSVIPNNIEVEIN